MESMRPRHIYISAATRGRRRRLIVGLVIGLIVLGVAAGTLLTALTV